MKNQRLCTYDLSEMWLRDKVFFRKKIEVSICFEHRMDCEKKQTCYVPFGDLFSAQALIKGCLQTTCSQPKPCASIPTSDSNVQDVLSAAPLKASIISRTHLNQNSTQIWL